MRDLYRYFGNINLNIPSTCTKDHPNLLYHFLGKLEPEDMFNFRVRSLEGLHNQASTLAMSIKQRAGIWTHRMYRSIYNHA